MNFTKNCNKCNLDLDTKYFDWRSDTKRYRNQCKKCHKGYISNRIDKQKEIKKLLKDNLKVCSKCKEIKNIDNFNIDKQTLTGKTSYCKECIKNKYNKEELKNFSYKTKYNISLDDYNKILFNQNNKYDICKLEFNNLVVDHNHKTGQVRGLLCNGCNSAIGFFKENINSIQESINYLEKNK